MVASLVSELVSCYLLSFNWNYNTEYIALKRDVLAFTATQLGTQAIVR